MEGLLSGTFIKKIPQKIGPPTKLEVILGASRRIRTCLWPRPLWPLQGSVLFFDISAELEAASFRPFSFFLVFLHRFGEIHGRKKTMENGIDNIEENFQLKW